MKAEFGHVFARGDEGERFHSRLHATKEAGDLALHDVKARLEQHGSITDGGRHGVGADFSDGSSRRADFVRAHHVVAPADKEQETRIAVDERNH